jgi:hypothetical protein
MFAYVSGRWDETLDLLRHVSVPLEGTLVLMCHVFCQVNEILHLVDHVIGLIDKVVGIWVMFLACYSRQRTYSAM